MKTEDLLNVVREQRINLNQFHEVVMLKQQALIMNDVKAIEGAIVREEKLIAIVERSERSRSEIVDTLKKRLNLNYASLRTTDFLESAKQFIEAKVMKEFQKELESIEELVEAIKGVNQQNQFLIANARQFIRKIIEAVAKSNKQSLLDRKA